MSKPRINICFFGITRSLKHTIDAIERNVLAPARAVGEVRLYSHFFLQRHVQNTRNDESGQLDMEEYKLLPDGQVQLEEPEACLETWDFEGLKAWGDFWNNEFQSLRNLIHQQDSLRKATLMALADTPEDQEPITLFCRPDLLYHDSLAGPLKAALKAQPPHVFLPRWQSWTGHNDRFAICCGRAAALAYGTRITQMRGFCETRSEPVHSERLVAHALRVAHVPVTTIRARASRVRVDGTQRWEDFAPPLISQARRQLHWLKRQVVPGR